MFSLLHSCPTFQYLLIFHEPVLAFAMNRLVAYSAVNSVYT